MTPDEILVIENHLRYGTAEVPIEEVLRLIGAVHQLEQRHADALGLISEMRTLVGGEGNPAPEWGRPWRMRAEYAEAKVAELLAGSRAAEEAWAQAWETVRRYLIHPETGWSDDDGLVLSIDCPYDVDCDVEVLEYQPGPRQMEEVWAAINRHEIEHNSNSRPQALPGSQDRT